jgi:hypothetical protein
MNKFLLFVAIALFGLTSCKKQDPIPTDPLQSITIGKDTLSLYVGGKKQINFVTSPADYSASLLTWSSSDSTIVSVNSNGIITAKKAGLSKITVSNKKGTVWTDCVVFVVPKPIVPPVDSLKIGLLAYYDFNNSGADSSGNKYDGTVHNITSMPNRFGKANGAYYFDGVSSYISVPDNQALRLNNTDFTLNAWIKLVSYNSSYGSSILSKRTTGANNGWIWSVIGNAANPVGAVTYGPGGGSFDAFGDKIITLGSWHMVTSVYNLASGQLKIYVDGILDNTTSGILTASASITSMLYIGMDAPNLNDNGYFFQGSMDDIRIYSRAISASEIQKLYRTNN